MSLVAWYPFNGNYVNNGCGDSDLTIVSTPTYSDNGKIGKALATGSFKWLASQTSSILNNQSVSIAFWVYPINTPDDTNKYSGILFGTDSMSTNGGRQYSLFLYPTCNDLHISWQNFDGTNYSMACGGTWSGLFPSQKWTHCCVTYDNPNGKIYINGELKHTFSGTYNTKSFAYETNVINNNANRYVNDFRVYNHCLSAKEIKEISKCLIVHYPLNQCITKPNLAKNKALTIYNNYSVTASLTALDETYKGGTVYRLTMTPTEDSLNNFKTAKSSHGVYGFRQTFLASTQYCFWIYYRPVTHTDVQVGGTASNIGGWTEIAPTAVDNEWYLVGQYRDGTATTDKTDNVFTSFYTPTAQAGVPISIDFCCPHLIQGYMDIFEDESYAWDDTVSEIADVSGYLNNGVFNGEYQNITGSPRYDKATKLASTNIGTSTITGAAYIKGTLQNVLATPSELTISWWGNAEDWSYQDSGLLCLSSNSSRPDDYLEGTLNQYDSKFRFNNSSGTGGILSATDIIKNNEWHHYVLKYNGTTLYGYCDNSIVSTSTLSGNLASFQYIYIGLSVAGGAYRQTTTNWCDFRIYATSLSDDDIYELYKTPISIANNGVLLVQGEVVEK